MRRLEAIIRMYDVKDWAWYDLNESDKIKEGNYEKNRVFVSNQKDV